MTRRVYQMVELTQRRCDLRFGIGACEATGTPKCFQTWATCRFRPAYNLDGVYRWRFVPESQTLRIPYEASGPDDITGHPIPCIRSIRTTPTKLNIGAIRRGESPFGIRSTLTVDFAEFPDEGRDGDFYLADRGELPPAGFWQKFVARLGDAIGQVEARHYVWYEGQDISEAVVSRFDIRNLTANKRGARLECDDPLQRAGFRKAKFPRETGAILRASISDTQTAGIEIALIGDEISRAYGNTGGVRYLRIGNEIIEYTGWSEDDGIYTLTGVTRGIRGSEAQSHDAGEAVQRVGRYVRERLYRVAIDLLSNHTTLGSALIDVAGWEAEGQQFLPTIQTGTDGLSGWVVNSEDVEKLVGECARDGLFHVWWDERAQLVKMQAVRAPLPGQDVPITQRGNIMASQFNRRPDDRLTRVIARFQPRDAFSDAPENYRIAFLRLDTDAEGDFEADGTIREKVIASRWLSTTANARLVASNLLTRYRSTPLYATVTLDAKDADIEVSGFVELTTPDYADAEGRPIVSLWEVISWQHDYRAGTVTLELQQSPYEGRFAFFTENTALDYDSTPADEREIGAWFADEATGLMPNGDEPYQFW